jgi:tetratricopeptide (TPR) repeat protein
MFSSARRDAAASRRAEENIDYKRQAYNNYARLLPRVEAEGEDYKRALSNMASCIFDEGAIRQYFLKRPAEALESYGYALSIFADVGDADGIGVVYKQAGEIFGWRDFPEFYDPERSAFFFERALSIFRENYLPRRMLETLYQIGRLFRRPYRAALEKFQEYLKIAGELQLSREQAIAKRHIAELTYLLHKEELAERGRPGPEQEEQFYTSVIGLAEEAARVLRVLAFDAWSRRALANCHYLMGRVYLDLGRAGQGLEQFKRSLEATQDAERFAGTEDVKRRALARLRIIQVLVQTGGTERLEQLYLYFEDMRGMASDFNRLDINLAALTEDTRRLDRLIGQLEAEE